MFLVFDGFHSSIVFGWNNEHNGKKQITRYTIYRNFAINFNCFRKLCCSAIEFLCKTGIESCQALFYLNNSLCAINTPQNE
jgi:hypothetical protein